MVIESRTVMSHSRSLSINFTHVFVLKWFILLSLLQTAVPSACYDFNFGAQLAKEANLSNVYTCPDHYGLTHSTCTGTYPMKELSKIEQSNVTWNEVLIYMIVGSHSIRTHVLYWWLQFLPTLAHDEKLQFVLISDACPVEGDNLCNDAATILMNEMKVSKFNTSLEVHVVRGQPIFDVGYQRLACKLVTGASRIYEQFPNHKYYFKIDDDTILFSRRLMSFIRTLDAIKPNNSAPLYFGTVSHVQHPDHGLCNEMAWKENKDIPIDSNLTLSDRGEVVFSPNPIVGDGLVPICYGQGGAGYGLNNIAMKALGDHRPLCVKDMDLESSSEDTFVGYKMYREFRTMLLHCEGFHSSLHRADAFLLSPYTITFHHVHDGWLNGHNATEILELYPDLF